MKIEEPTGLRENAAGSKELKNDELEAAAGGTGEIRCKSYPQNEMTGDDL